MKRTTAVFTGVTASAFSPLVLAHAGHDHGHWSSGLLHAVTALAIVGAGAVVVSMIRRKRRRNSTITTAE